MCGCSASYNTVDNKLIPIEEKCIENEKYSRMENVAKYAKENGYDAFTTTLFISPYQQHELLKRICG